MKVYAVIDTNVLVSALLAKRPDSAPVQILDRLFSRDFIPMYNEEIVAEYNEVLRRPKFKFPEEQIAFAVEALLEAGIDSIRVKTDDEVLDPKDIVFYEVAMSRDAYPPFPCPNNFITSYDISFTHIFFNTGYCIFSILRLSP